MTVVSLIFLEDYISILLRNKPTFHHCSSCIIASLHLLLRCLTEVKILIIFYFIFPIFELLLIFRYLIPIPLFKLIILMTFRERNYWAFRDESYMYATWNTCLDKSTHISKYSFIFSILILSSWELLQNNFIQSAKGILLTERHYALSCNWFKCIPKKICKSWNMIVLKMSYHQFYM